jgi:RNA polymerase sigma factor (sigma-70 family)
MSTARDHMPPSRAAIRWPELTTIRLMPVRTDEPGDRPPRPDFTELVKLARDGDGAAKEALVEALQRLVWHTIAGFGLSREDRQDVFAGAFCRMFEQIERDAIRDPERLPGWIATTARNEAKTLLRVRGRVVVSDELADQEDSDPPTDSGLLDMELGTALRQALRVLPDNCQALLRLVTAVPAVSYEEISEILGMPHGSIGPTRQRCLDRLRNTPQLRPFLEGGHP